MTDADTTATEVLKPVGHRRREGIPRWIRHLAIPIILGWLAIAGLVNVAIPQLEEVGAQRTVSMSPQDAPSVIAMKRVGTVFQEFQSDSSVMIVLEGDQPLGDEAHRYYEQIVEELLADTKHVEHVQDFWSDPLTAAGSQSNDGKAAYVQVYLHGNQGESLANESVEAAQAIVAGVPAPPGITAYVTGPAALQADMHIAGDRSLKLITGITFGVILVLLLLIYRSIITTILALLMVGVAVASARGVVAALAHFEVIGLSTFAVNLLTMVAIAASTDYVIFLLGRYQEAREHGEDRNSAYYTMFHGTSHVIIGSGLTIAGATFCLHFTRLPYFQTLGVPMAIGMIVIILAALTLGPAVVTVAGALGALDPKRKMRTRGWRRVGTVVVRWPGPILIATIGLSLVGLLAIPGYRTDYNERHYLPDDIPANVGYAAADRHFSSARLNPELLMIETDHDMRNPADFLVIDKIAKAVFGVPGVSRVQAITRPLGSPIAHTSIPFQISMQGVTQQMNQKYMDNMMADMLKQAEEMQQTIDTMNKMQGITEQMAATTHSMVTKMKDMTIDVAELRDHIADFDDFFRPMRNYFYWEPHCFNIPGCWAIRSIFDTLDGIDTMTDDIQQLLPDMEKLDTLMPQMVKLMPEMVETMQTMKKMMLTMYQTQNGMQQQMKAMQDNSSAMGEAFDASKNDDSFYLPPEAFENPEFKRGMKQFLSPDGKAVRFIISHEGDPMSPEGVALIEPILQAAKEAIKGTPLEGSEIFLGGTAATFKDMQEGSNWDLLIAGISALALIFIIMLIITRAVIASAVIVGTVTLSLGTSFGLSVLLWQHLLGQPLHWMVLAMSVIILLAVGSDYNLLLVARFKEEIHAGLNTGIIRAMAGSGSVVTSAGLVFAFTMATMAISDLKVIAQVGTTIAIGLLFDTLVIRSFMVPSIAALMGRWFWWPQLVGTHAARPIQREPEPAPTP